MIADACGRQVAAGPVEATALGNIVVQAVACGELPGIAAGRQAVAASCEQKVYEPRPAAGWEDAIARFAGLATASSGAL